MRNTSAIHECVVAAVDAALEAGQMILAVYGTDFAVETKSDRSPLTLADRRAHECIMRRLKPLNIPVLSEEGREIPYAERRQWQRFWLVDPLDGTKEFIKRNGEFTVNIALIEDRLPVAGVIYAPVPDRLYAGVVGGSARSLERASRQRGALSAWRNFLAVTTALPPERAGRVTVVASRSHRSAETDAYIAELTRAHGTVERVSVGSSLKFCMVADGTATHYPRFAPTMEWDTAAGHALVKATGRQVVDYRTGQELRYNKECLRNGWFVVC